MKQSGSISKDNIIEDEVLAIHHDLVHVTSWIAEDEDAGLLLHGTDGMLYQAYLTYLAVKGGVEGKISDDEKIALGIVGQLKNDHTNRVEESFISPSYHIESYISAFHKVIEEKYFLTRASDSGEEARPIGITGWLITNFSEYQSFIESVLDKKGGRVLDCCPEFLPFYFSFEQFEEYLIYERDEKMFAFYVLRKAIEGKKWNNVNVVREVPQDVRPFDRVIVSTYSLASKRTGSLRYCYKSLISDEGAAIILSYDYDKDCGIIDPDKLYLSLSIPDSLFIFGNLFVLGNKSESTGHAIFVDGQSFFMDKRGENEHGFFSSELAETIERRDANYVIEVPHSDILEDNYFPGFYLLRNKLSKKDSVLLGEFIHHYGEDEMFVYEDGAVPDYIWGKDFEVSDISTDPRLLQTSRTEGYGPYESPNEYWVNVEEPFVLLVLCERRKIEVGFLTKTEGSTMKVSIAVEKSFFSGFDGLFGVKSKDYDIKYLTLYLRSLPIRAGVDYFSSPWDILGLPVPAITLEQQELELKVYLTKLANSYISQLPEYHSKVNAIVMVEDPNSYISGNQEGLDKLNIRVLEYVKDADALKAAIKKHSVSEVSDVNIPKIVLVSVDNKKNDIVQTLCVLSNTGLQSYFFSTKCSVDLAELSLGNYAQNWIKENFFSGELYLEEIRKRIDSNSFDILEEYPEYLEFFKVAKRFDSEYPDWKLWDYVKRVLSKKPLELDINDFRSKIDETIGKFFRVNHVVPDDEKILPNGAIPDLLYRAPYENNETGVKISLYEHLERDTRKKEEWIRAAYMTIRKLGNSVSHTSKENTQIKASQSIGVAAFTLFTEILIWLDKDEVRERYMFGRTEFFVTPIVKDNNTKRRA